MRKLFRALPLALLSVYLLAAACPVWAASICSQIFRPKTMRLLRQNQPVESYKERLESLQPGDQVDFGQGRLFPFHGYLSNPQRGDLTTIIDIGGGKALRVSRHYNYTATRTPLTMAQEMRDWFTLMEELDKNGVPVVKVDRQESQPPMFIVVQKENFLFRLSDLFVNGKLSSKNPALQNTDPEVIQVALKKLVSFASKTWMYRNIGDFRYEQLGYNGQDWVLFDVGARQHSPLSHFDEKFHTFSDRSEDPGSGSVNGNLLPKIILQEIDSAITEKRREAALSSPWITRVSGSTRNGRGNYLFDGITREPLEKGRIFNVKSGDPQTSLASSYILDSWVEDRISLKVISHFKRGPRFSSYQVRLSNGSPAILKVLLWNSDENLDRLRKKVEELKDENDPTLIAYGTDFIVLKP